MKMIKKIKTLNKPKTYTKRIIDIRSRHPSIDPLRRSVFANVKAVYRHGSTTKSLTPYEVNSIQAVENSSSKRKMKECFDAAGVKHLPWILLSKASVTDKGVNDGKVYLSFPVVIKQFFGSRGNGNYKVENREEFEKTIAGKTISNYLIEQYYSGSAEYRVHITEYGPIYSLRKRLKGDIPKEKRWVRNDATCVWITEFEQLKDASNNFVKFTDKPNKSFDKPGNWEEIIQECKKALKAVGGDVLAVDVRAQTTNSSKGKRQKVEFYILEVNSAPSMGNITLEVYKEHLPKIIRSKYGK